MSYIKFFAILFVFTILTSCEEESTLPKPTGFLRLKYPKATYKKAVTVPYEFETNKIANVKVNGKYWMKIEYPKLKASIDITYRPVNNNVIELLKESEKLTTKHAIKADAIYYDAFENESEKVYGKLSNVTGNAASSLQFHLTDSTKHFLTGAVYFNTQPNYDSIYPAIKYIEKDIIRLMNTAKWRTFN
jgi:gliding motility-associated lipoprotein GldD